MPHLLDLGPLRSVRCHVGEVQAVFHAHEFLAALGPELARLLRLRHRIRLAAPADTSAEVRDILRRAALLFRWSESDADADADAETLRAFFNVPTSKIPFLKWNARRGETDELQYAMTAQAAHAVLLEIAHLVAVLTADILHIQPDLEHTLRAQDDAHAREHVRALLARCIARDFSALSLVNCYENNEETPRPKAKRHCPPRVRGVSDALGFRFDDLEPEPGPKFQVRSFRGSQRETDRLNSIYHADREARLEEQRATQQTVFVTNPLRRNTSQQISDRRAETLLIIKQKKLETQKSELETKNNN